MTRFCPECTQERAFEQFHAEPGSCPDGPDGECQEWGCTICGCALVIGLPADGYNTGKDVFRAA